MTTQTDLFGEPAVKIPGNPTLEKAANLILRAVKDNPDLLDGATIGIIDRQVRFEIWASLGLTDILPPDLLEKVREFVLDSKRCIDPEVINRARRWLMENDYIRVSAAAVQEAERQRVRLAGNFKGDK